MDSKQPVQNVDKTILESEDVCQEVHSHKNLHQIFKILWGPSSVLKDMAPRGSFNDLVFRLVFFHQSMRGLSKFGKQMMILDDDELFMYCDPLLLKYMLIMQSADSSSYLFMNKAEEAKLNTLAFEVVNLEMHQIWMRHYHID